MSTGHDTADPARDSAWVTIRLAGPETVRFWSSGEVTAAKTVLPPTARKAVRYHPDGLFSERIFGCQFDWECDCGKLAGKHCEGQKCPACGVKVTTSDVRRQRMGHIELAAPVVHPWFLRSAGSPLAALLGAEPAALKQVVYYDRFVVLDPGATDLRERDLLTDRAYLNAREKYGDAFHADTGAAAVEALLKRLNLDDLCRDLRRELADPACPPERRAVLVQRSRVAEALRQSGNPPDGLVFRHVPVIPPDLRPMVPLDRPLRGHRDPTQAGGPGSQSPADGDNADRVKYTDRFLTTDLNELYRQVIECNAALKHLIARDAPGVLLREQKRELQRAVDALLDRPGAAPRRGRRRAAARGRPPLKSLTGLIAGQPTGKQGRFRASLLGKRVDYSGRSVIVNGPELKLHQCGLPRVMALVLYRPFLVRALLRRGAAPTLRTALGMIDRRDPRVWPVLEDVVRGRPVLLNRAPTLHRMSVQAFEPVLIDGKAIRLHPLACKGFNADFDGDTMAVHLPLSEAARREARDRVLSTRHLFSPADGKPIFAPSLDIVLGCYYQTADPPAPARGETMTFAGPAEVLLAHAHGKVGTHTPVRVRLPAHRAVVLWAVRVTRPGATAFRVGDVVGRDVFAAAGGRLGDTRPVDDLPAAGPVTACVRVDDPGDSYFAARQVVDPAAFRREVARLNRDRGAKPPRGRALAGPDLQRVVDRCVRVQAAGASRFDPGAIVSRKAFQAEYQRLLARAGRPDGVPVRLRAHLPAEPSPGRRVTDPGDSDFAAGEVVGETAFRRACDELARDGRRPPSGEVVARAAVEWLQVETSGDSAFAAGDLVCRATFGRECERLAAAGDGWELPTARPFPAEWVRIADGGDSDYRRGQVVPVDDFRRARGRLARTNQAPPRGEPVRFLPAGRCVDTSAGRVLFDDLLPRGTAGRPLADYHDLPLTGPEVAAILLDCHRRLGPAVAVALLDRVKEFGLRAATRSGLSFATADLPRWARWRVVNQARRAAARLHAGYERGLLTADERDGQLLNLWHKVQDAVARRAVDELTGGPAGGGRPDFNPVAVMLTSGARGSADQLRQLAGMRGYMAAPPGRAPAPPITASLRDGLHPFDFIACARGGRLTLYNMRASTPEWGYLTRRMVYAAQDVFVSADDCGAAGPARRPLTCQAPVGVCRACYGPDLSTGRPAELFLPVGIIAAQSLGERGSQLTLHTKRSGGAAAGGIAGAWTLLERVLDAPPEEHPPGTDMAAVGDRIARRVQDLFRDQGAAVDPRHVEVIVAQMVRKARVVHAGDSGLVPGELVDRAAVAAVNDQMRARVRVDDPGDSAFARGQVVDRAAAEREGERLKSEQRRVPTWVPAAEATAAPCVLGISDVALASNSFLAAAAFGRARDVLSRAALAAEVDDLIGPLERIIAGRPLPPAADLTAPRLPRRAGRWPDAPPLPQPQPRAAKRSPARTGAKAFLAASGGAGLGGLSDEELLRRYYARGPESDAAFAVLDGRYRGRLTDWAAAKMGGDEGRARRVAQRTLVKVSDTIGKDSRWQDGEPFKPWLEVILQNTLTDEFRKPGVVGTGTDVADPDDDGRVVPFGDGMPAPRPGPEDAASAGERERILRDGMARLPDRQRAVVTMIEAGKSGQEIARALGVRPGTVSKDWTAARASLEKWLSDHGVAPPPVRRIPEEQVRRCVEQLPEPQRAVVELKVFRKLLPKKIAKALNLDRAAVTRHLKDAERTLKARLGGTVTWPLLESSVSVPSGRKGGGTHA